ncbi:MAG: signal recognition particle-docking protein FtsY [Actinobacteria bacterium]|nr:signal recognition particle-docking protein FtsY [Actinomycetota bacterium]
MPWFKRLSEGLSRSRDALQGHLSELMGRGPKVDDEFWTDLEDALIVADMGVMAATEIVSRLRRTASRLALPDAAAVLSHLTAELAAEFEQPTQDLLEGRVTLIMVGVNGTGKTTTVGKLAKQAVDSGRSVLLGSADTFRAAANEQLDVWAKRAGVEVVKRDSGEDPASVAFDTVAAARERAVDITIIDTAGRLHTSVDLMRELQKIQKVTRREADASTTVKTILTMDATTGQNGLVQAREFHAALDLDGVILTKLDGTAKGGIVVAVARELGLPVVMVGVGEGIEDLRPFNPEEFAAALIGSS